MDEENCKGSKSIQPQVSRRSPSFSSFITLVFRTVNKHTAPLKSDKMPGKMSKAKEAEMDFSLRRVFGKPSFRQVVVSASDSAVNADYNRPMQREVVLAALEGHDVFLQAATSFGKSLCYQLPAVVDFGRQFHHPSTLKDHF